MIKFCKLCLITGLFMIFWMPNATPFSWNFKTIYDNDMNIYLNFLFIIPFILTFVFGFILSKSEFILFIIGSLLSSFIHEFIAVLDYKLLYPLDFLNVNIYFSLLINFILQVSLVAISYSLGMLVNNYFSKKNPIVQNDNIATSNSNMGKNINTESDLVVN